MISKVMPGDVFAFETSIPNRNGLIQIIGKGKIGLNIRVFYNLIEDGNNTILKSIIESENFYYIRDFYEFELINKSKIYLGNFKLPAFIKMPRYMRKSERLNSNLKWYIFDTYTDKIVAKDEKIHCDFDNLSPFDTWGIDYIKKRWQEGFTLLLWSEFEEFWYNDYLRKDSSNSLNNIDSMNVLELKKKKPTTSWTLKSSQYANVTDTRKFVISYIDQQLDEFIDSIGLSNIDLINEALIRLINKLNLINSKYSFIETEESEDLVIFIDSVLRLSKFYQNTIDFNSIRNW